MNIFNVPYWTSTNQSAPLSKIDDGTSDIVLQTANRRRGSLYMFIDRYWYGEYFHSPRGGEKAYKIRDRLRMHYLKATKWCLKPEIKGPVPYHLVYELLGDAKVDES